MKKILILILICCLGKDLIGQPPIKRAGSANTVEDYNLFAIRSFRPPVFIDTATANMAITLDSCGKIIFTYDGNKLWKRQCNPKVWVEIGSGGGGGDSISVLSTVTQISSLSRSNINQLVVTDTLRGGNFNLYAGSDTADEGMIFEDALGRKWLRQVEGSEINIRWYGLNPYNNYVVDDAPVFRVAIDYIHKHSTLFTTLYCPRGTDPTTNSWYLIGSTLTLQSISIVGDGLQEDPLTSFQVLPDVKAFDIPALDHTGNTNHVNVKNIQVTHYDPVTAARNNHTFDIRCFVDFDNVKISRNFNGNGFNIVACGSSVDSSFGNADHNNFNYCQANFCENGMFISGCDANIMNIMNCSFVSNRYWGVYDNGLLGNIYFNPHLSNNGKQGDCIVTYGGLYYVSLDSTNNVGKRPDLEPTYWYEVTAMGGAFAWDTTRHYYSGGTIAVTNVNAFTKIIAPYTESYQPPMQLGLRSTTEGGDNAAGVRGGLNIHPVNGILYVDNDTHLGGIATDKLYVGPTPTGNVSIHAQANDYYAALFEGINHRDVYIGMKNTAGFGDGGIGYYDSVMITLAGGQESLASAYRATYPYNTDNFMDLGKVGNRFKDTYTANNYYGNKMSLGSTTAPTDNLHIRGVSLSGMTIEGSNPTLTLNRTSGTDATMNFGSSIIFDRSNDLFIRGYNSERHSLIGTAGLGYFGYVGPSFNMAFSIGSTSAPTSTLQSYGSFSLTTVNTAVDYTAGHYDKNIFITATGKTITLPTAVGIQGREYTIKLTAVGSSTVATTSSQTIDGSTTYSLSEINNSVTLVSDNANWLIVSTGSTSSGTYTPTLTNVANVAASTAYSCQYSRVGTVVTVSGEVDIDPTTTLTLTQLGISLPIASNLTATNELGGTSADDLNTAARVAGDATNNRAEIRMTPVDVTNRRFSFTFTYRVL